MTPQYKAARAKADKMFPCEGPPECSSLGVCSECSDRLLWMAGADFGYAQAQAENSAVIAAKDAEIDKLNADNDKEYYGYREEKRVAEGILYKANCERDEWKQQAEKLRGALEFLRKRGGGE